MTPAASRGDLAVLGLVALVLFTAGLGARDLWNPNEPLYGRAVVEMVEADSWTRATVNSIPFDEKPVLYFWLARLAALAWGGVDETSLRLPAALSGVAAVLLLYLLAVPYAGRRRARLAALLLSTTFVVFWSAHRVQMDVTLTACTLGVLLPFTRWADHGARGGRAWFVAGAAAGLGVLTKGPVGLICPGLPLALEAVLRRRTLPQIGPCLPAAALVGFAVVAAPWYAALALDGGATALGELLWRQNVQRFFDPWDHQAPWWYFAKYVWIDFAPWVWFVPLAVALEPDDPHEARLHRLAWIWLLSTVLFFSLSASKRSPYVMPAAPAVALLVAAVAARWIDGRLAGWRAVSARAVALAWGALLLAGAPVVARATAPLVATDPALAPRVREAAALFAATGAAVLVAWAFGSRRRRLAASVLFAAIVAVEGVAVWRLVPAANPYKSHRALCAEINRHVPADRPLAGFDLWRWRAGYSYYAERDVANLDGPDALREYWHAAEPSYLIVERGKLDDARRVIGDAVPLVRRAVGHNEVWLFVNPAGTPSPVW